MNLRRIRRSLRPLAMRPWSCYKHRLPILSKVRVRRPPDGHRTPASLRCTDCLRTGGGRVPGQLEIAMFTESSTGPVLGWFAVDHRRTGPGGRFFLELG